MWVEKVSIPTVTFLTASKAQGQLLTQVLAKPNPQSLTSESSTQASNEFKLEKQGYQRVTLYAGIRNIIPLILDLEGSLNFTIDSTRPHKLPRV